MKSSIPMLLASDELHQVSGGVGPEELTSPYTKALAIGGLIYATLEIPHVFMGVREFVNYSVGHLSNGCSAIEKDDYFGRFLAYPFCGSSK